MVIGEDRRQGGGKPGRQSPEQNLLFFKREAEEHVRRDVGLKPLQQHDGVVPLSPGKKRSELVGCRRVHLCPNRPLSCRYRAASSKTVTLSGGVRSWPFPR